MPAFSSCFPSLRMVSPWPSTDTIYHEALVTSWWVSGRGSFLFLKDVTLRYIVYEEYIFCRSVFTLQWRVLWKWSGPSSELNISEKAASVPRTTLTWQDSLKGVRGGSRLLHSTVCWFHHSYMYQERKSRLRLSEFHWWKFHESQNFQQHTMKMKNITCGNI